MSNKRNRNIYIKDLDIEDYEDIKIVLKKPSMKYFASLAKLMNNIKPTDEDWDLDGLPELIDKIDELIISCRDGEEDIPFVDLPCDVQMNVVVDYMNKVSDSMQGTFK